MMKLKTLALVTMAGLALSMAGCKKDKPADPGPGTAATDGSGTAAASGSAMADGSGSAGSAAADGSGSAVADGSGSAGSAAADGSGSAAAAVDPNADRLEVFAKHNDPSKPDVTVTFPGVKVVKASFDPAKLEGGTAELEVELATLSSGIEKRDGHLKTPDYLDADKFPKATIKIDNVKGAGDKKFTADATVKVHDVEQKLPVTFTVVDAKDDWIRIQGETSFTRAQFKVGKPDKEDGAADALTAKLQVTLKKS